MHYLSIQNYEYVSKTLSFSEVNVIPLYFDKYCKPLQRVINTASAVQDDTEPWTIPTELTLVFSLIVLGVANWLMQIVIVPYPPAISFLLSLYPLSFQKMQFSSWMHIKWLCYLLPYLLKVNEPRHKRCGVTPHFPKTKK